MDHDMQYILVYLAVRSDEGVEKFANEEWRAGEELKWGKEFMSSAAFDIGQKQLVVLRGLGPTCMDRIQLLHGGN